MDPLHREWQDGMKVMDPLHPEWWDGMKVIDPLHWEWWDGRFDLLHVIPYMGNEAHENIEMWNIWSLIWGIKRKAHMEARAHIGAKVHIKAHIEAKMHRWQIHSVMKDKMKMRIEQYGETDIELGKILCVYNTKEFRDHLVSTVNVVMIYCHDVDQWSNKKRVSSIISNEWHLKAMLEELACKWNIRIHMAKDTIHVMTQHGIRMVVHPMMIYARVDHLNLHHQRLEGNMAHWHIVVKRMQGKSFTDFKDDGIPEWLITDGAHAHYITYQLLSKMMDTLYDKEESTKMFVRLQSCIWKWVIIPHGTGKWLMNQIWGSDR
jgi:hypothetical protein